MKKNNYTKTQNLFKIIFLFVVFLGIGYAFLEANLNINGDTTVEAPELNVYVQSTSVTTGSTSGTPTIIGNDKKEVDFTTALTSDSSSFFEETTTLVNKGSKKAYIRNINVKVYDSNNNEVTLTAPYEYILTHGDGTAVDSADEIAINGTQTYKFKLNYISGTDMTTVTDYPSYTFKITYNFKKDIIDLPTGKTKDNLEVGDEICIKGECFYFIKYDGINNEDIVLLTRYNLKVGYIYNSSWVKVGEYTSSDSGYGKQSSKANGVVAFSKVNYWDDNESPKSQYQCSYYTVPYCSIYDPINYKGEPGEDDYSIAYYVEAYKDILSNYGVTIKDARLLTLEEVTDSSIGCVYHNCSCPTNTFITETSFWLGTATSKQYIQYVASHGYFNDNDYSENSFGVRPVIVISKSSF